LKTKKKNKKEIPVPIIKHNRIIYLLFLVFIPLVLYFRVVNFGLSELDDDTIISGINNTEGSKINLKEAFTHDAMMSDRGDSFYRPVQILTLMIDSEIGGGEIWIYHFSNLILHILTVITLFFFLKKTGIKEEISFLLALLFSVNPVFTNAVAWIPARGDLLLCLFSLLSFMSIIEYLKNGKKVYIIVHGIVFAGAMFSKETAVLLPVLILSFLYFVQRKKFLLKEIIPFLIIWSVTFVFYFALRQSVLKINHTANEFGIIPFLKNLPAIPITIGKFFIPFNLCTLPFFNTIAEIIGIILVIVITLLVIKSINWDKRIYLWGALWFLTFTIPPMLFRSIDPNLGIEKYDYLDFRTYLPMTGLLVVVGYLINEWFTTISFKKILIYFIPILAIYSYIAFNYSAAFSDSISFYISAINANPDNIINLVVRGTIYYGQGNIHDAMLDFDNAIRIHPTYSLPYYNRGLIYETINDHYQAENSFSLALKYDTLYKENNFLQESSYLNLSSEKIILKKYDEAISILKKAISKYPANSTIHFNLGLVYNYSAKYDSALNEYNKGIESEKDSPEYYNNRGMVKDSLKDFAGAIADFSKALKLKQDYSEALKNRGLAKIRMNDNEGAVNDLTKLINIYPNAGELWYYRGLAYSKFNKTEEASKDLEQAWKLGFKKP
jgi:protein O-mannosyl-transferase